MTENEFDKAAASWDDNPRRMEMTKTIAEAIDASIPLNGDMSMLEFGCGTGALSVLLSGRVGNVQSVDTSSGMIAELEGKLAAAPKLAARITPQLLTPPITQTLTGSWDVICSAMVLHHIEDACGTFRHLAGLLSPGGYLAVADLYLEDGSFHARNPVPHNGFDPVELAELAKDAGLGEPEVTKVMTFQKPGTDGELRDYSIFLLKATARK